MAITVIIDDEDPSIQYSGRWAPTPSSGNNHTVHGTTDANAQAILKFKGSSVSVYGSLIRFAAFTPTVSFGVDNMPAFTFIGKPSETDSLVKQHFYTSPALNPFEEHTIVIKVIMVSRNAFYIDFFQVVQEEEEAANKTPNTPSIPVVLTPTQTTPLNNRSSPPTSVTPLFSSSSPVLTGISSTISTPSPLAVSAASSIPTSYPPGLNRFSDATTATVTATQTQSSSPQSPGNQSNSTIIGAAVGGSVGGLVIIIALVFLLRILRRRAKAKIQLQSSRQATAFPSMASPTTPTSEWLSRGYESGPGYIVRGGLSKEKAADRPSNEERQVSNTRESGPFGLEPLPAYESDYGDATPLRREPK